MKFIQNSLIISILAICLCLFSACEENDKANEDIVAEYSYDIQLYDDIIHVISTESNTKQTRTYSYSNANTSVEMIRLLDNNADSFFYELPENSVLRFVDNNLEWNFVELNKEVKVPYSPCYYIDGEGLYYWIYMPQNYRLLENNSLEYLASKKSELAVKEYESGLGINIIFDRLGKNCVADFCVVKSEKPLFPWGENDNKADNFMKGYNLDGDGRWCYDGYYFKTDDSYEPHGKNVFHFCVDSYIIKSFVAGLRYDACRFMVPAMLDTMISHQNEIGYIPTYSLSTWLKEDYGVEKGFYDTRFNTDFFDILLNAYSELGGDRFKDAAIKYTNFYINHAKNRNIATENGYFVADYYNKNCKLTHASLNHNLAEAELMFKLYDFLGNQDCLDAANSIISAIEDTYQDWIMIDNNLEYAICPDGSFAYTDYPYLTYNDLFDTQNMLIKRGLEPSKAIEALMNAKKSWMDANNIVEYKK